MGGDGQGKRWQRKGKEEVRRGIGGRRRKRRNRVGGRESVQPRGSEVDWPREREQKERKKKMGGRKGERKKNKEGEKGKKREKGRRKEEEKRKDGEDVKREERDKEKGRERKREKKKREERKGGDGKRNAQRYTPIDATLTWHAAIGYTKQSI